MARLRHGDRSLSRNVCVAPYRIGSIGTGFGSSEEGPALIIVDGRLAAASMAVIVGGRDDYLARRRSSIGDAALSDLGVDILPVF